MSTEKELILLCRTRIEQILNWGDSSLWTNSDFELLSDKIFEKTTVRLSISTLKRIWGKVKYDNSPTAATLNALANFLDYASWRDFESENNKQEPAEIPAPTNTRRSPVRIATMAGIALAAVVIIFLLVRAMNHSTLFASSSAREYDASKASFSHRETTTDLPNSVVFDYDVSSFGADSAFIQQTWDPMRRDKISPEGKQHTSVYFEPGYFKAKLIVNDTILKEDVVWIKTNGWKGLLGSDNKTPIYLSENDIRLKDGGLGFTSEVLEDKWKTTVFTMKPATLHNVKDFNVDVSNFEFETMLRNTSSPEQSACRIVAVTFLTSIMAMEVQLSTKGCISELGLLTTNGYKSGKENDFSAFGADFKTPEKLNISIKDSVFSVVLNDKVIFTEKQNNPVGEIVGIRVGFEGAGEMKYAKLNGQLIE